MLVVLTNIPTPYRSAFFNTLKEELQRERLGLHILYCAETEPRRFWKFEPELNDYDYTFLKGFHPEFKNYYPHFNIGAGKKIRELKPKWILMGGSWNSPTVVQTLLFPPYSSAKIIFWSEGHIDAQRSKLKI